MSGTQPTAGPGWVQLILPGMEFLGAREVTDLLSPYRALPLTPAWT